MSYAKINGKEYNLDKIFSDEFFFKIPLFQRPYAWTTKHSGALLEDLLESIKEEQPNPYFLGCIVLIKEEGNSESQVVDGQQRLITLTILLSVLRHLSNEDYAKALTKRLYEEGDPIGNKPDRYRLILKEQDAAFFRDYIQKERGIEPLIILDSKQEEMSESQIHIRDNAKLFLSKLEKCPETQRIRLIDFVNLQCFMVVVSSPDFDSAYRIFSIINDRGLDLSHADIFKSEIIGKIAAPETQQKYAEKWENIEDQLGRDAFLNLFSHIRMIKHPVKLRKGFREDFREFVIDPIGDPKKVIDEIVKYAGIYDDIINSSYESSNCAEEINRELSWLNHIDNADWIPPAIFYMWSNKNPADLYKFFKDLERLAAGLMIRRADVNERIRRYGLVIKTIEENRDLYDELSPLQLTTEERNEIINILQGDLYLETQFRLYVLLRLNEALSDGTGKFNFPRITIEHVLPQTIDAKNQWETWFKPPLHEEYIHKLGNLALLTRKKGASVSNHEFEKKKEEYAKDRFGLAASPLIMRLMNEKSWTPEVIDRHQQELINKLKEIWRL